MAKVLRAALYFTSITVFLFMVYYWHGIHGEWMAEEPRTNIVFLKTHKTGGSTIQNVLMRYGFQRRLNFVLPNTGNYLGYTATGYKFHPDFIDELFRLKIQKFNILCHHARFEFDNMKKVMEKSPTFVTIVREPATLFESLYNYAGFERITNMSLTEMIESPNATLSLKNDRVSKFLGFNQTLFDLGFDVKDSNEENLRSVLKTIDSQFDLVMIMEKFDESLILLKDLMNWNFEDIVYFSKNVRANATRLETDVLQKLRNLNSGDNELYKYFREKLDEKIKNYGDARMKSEVAILQELNKKWMERCVFEAKSNKDIEDAIQRGYFPNAIGYELKRNIPNLYRNTCNLLTLPELQLTNMIRENQMERIKF